MNVDGINENEFAAFLTKFTDSYDEYGINLKCTVTFFKQIRKINRNIFDIILRVLEVKVEEINEMKKISLESYLKLRYFFIDKKAVQ